MILDNGQQAMVLLWSRLKNESDRLFRQETLRKDITLAEAYDIVLGNIHALMELSETIRQSAERNGAF